MILNDIEITELANAGMISPFVDHQVREEPNELYGIGTGSSRFDSKTKKVISYGLSSFGYDIRISNQFKVFTNINSSIIDPKNFDEKAFQAYEGDTLLIPPNSYVLGRSVERMDMPRDITGICLGKSTYARAGILANMTPLESQWRGYITIEISNASPLPAKIYANEGIMQVLFFRGNPCKTSYNDRPGQGKYQDQQAEVVSAKV